MEYKQIRDFGIYHGFSDMPDIMVLQETISDIALWIKSKMASISARLSYKLTPFSTEWT